MILALGLRGKSLVSVLSASVVTLLVVAVVAWQALSVIENHYAAAFTRNYALVLKQRMVAPINRELALALRLARSQLTLDWILDENNVQKKNLFFREAEGYRQDFFDRSFFIASAVSQNYYYNDEKSPATSEVRYTLDRQKDENQWFFKTLQSADQYNINVSPDPKLGLTKVWLNFLVKDANKTIAVAGTGLDLTQFVNRFVKEPEAGVETMAIDESGNIQAHKDVNLISFRANLAAQPSQSTLAKLLKSDAERTALRGAMIKARENDESASEFFGTLNGKRQLIAVSWSPQLNWFVVAAVDLNVAQFFSTRWLAPYFLIAIAGLLAALMVYLWMLNRFLLQPISSLTTAAVQVASGNLTVALPPAGSDELGVLTKAFALMVKKVGLNRLELERAVQFRTLELEQANKELVQIAQRDELTGLGNRRMLQSHLKGIDTQLRQAPLEATVTVALLDIDHFKVINDTYGHEAGDAVLVRIAQILREQIRATDVCGRWGGEEFLVILPGTAVEEASLVLQRINEMIGQSKVAYGKVNIQFKASIGLAQNRHEEPIDELIKRADAALYRAKDNGRNRVVYV